MYDKFQFVFGNTDKLKLVLHQLTHFDFVTQIVKLA
jgi:phage-related holin